MADTQIKVSVKCCNLLFHGCDTEYVKNVCHGNCCKSSAKEYDITVAINKTEEEKIIDAGGIVVQGLLQRINNLCPFQNEDWLCAIHDSGYKPFGCTAAPFKLNKNGTLIIWHRYYMLRCYGNGSPAYKVFRQSLDKIFGAAESERICSILDSGTTQQFIAAKISKENYDILCEYSNIESGKQVSNKFVEWFK